MSRYIDKDKLLDDLNWHAPSEYNAKVNEVITKQPEADVVEVVRCKDCEYYVHNTCTHSYIRHFCDDNDYCSYGERKENDWQTY